MKKLICGVGLLVLTSACNQTNTTKIIVADTISTGKNSIQYVCPMDADVIKNKPGVCPKCGMKLVKK